MTQLQRYNARIETFRKYVEQNCQQQTNRATGKRSYPFCLTVTPTDAGETKMLMTAMSSIWIGDFHFSINDVEAISSQIDDSDHIRTIDIVFKSGTHVSFVIRPALIGRADFSNLLNVEVITRADLEQINNIYKVFVDILHEGLQCYKLMKRHDSTCSMELLHEWVIKIEHTEKQTEFFEVDLAAYGCIRLPEELFHVSYRYVN